MKSGKRYIYTTVFFSGMIALAVEMSAARLLGNVFGTSNLVWACIIGLILIYLAAGYWLGGRLADKHPTKLYFYRILAWAGLTVGLIPLIARPVLRVSANAFDQMQVSILFGAFAAVMVLFIIPVTLLGTASPFAMKLILEDTQTAGKTAGKISAVSTLGSFIGTFLPGLILIPLIGTYRTFLFFAGSLILIALIGLWLEGKWRAVLPLIWMPLVIILLAVFGTRGTDKTSEGMIYETESTYNYIQVLESEDYRFLRLNEGQGVHSIYHPSLLNYYGPWAQVIVAPFFNDYASVDEVSRMAIVGLAAGTTAREAAAVYENIVIDGYEIDPKIVQVGKDYFDMNLPNLNVFVQDGRWGLSKSPFLYDVISVDAYRPPYIPAHMTTLEFFQIAHDHLEDDGVLVINVGRSPTDRSLIDGLSTTIRQIFPTIFVMDIPQSFNTMIYATKSLGSWEYFQLNYARMANDAATHPLLRDVMAFTLENRAMDPEMTHVYTDDWSPVEWVTNNMVLSFVFANGLESFDE